MSHPPLVHKNSSRGSKDLPRRGDQQCHWGPPQGEAGAAMGEMWEQIYWLFWDDLVWMIFFGMIFFGMIFFWMILG